MRIDRFSPRLHRASRLSGLLLTSLLLAPVARLEAQTRPARPLAEAADALERGDLATAEARFLAARERLPESHLPLVGLAEVARRRGDLVTAVELARRARELAGEDDAPTALALGRLQASLGAGEAALETLSAACASVATRVPALVLSAMLLRDENRIDEAVALLDGALDEGVDDPAIRVQLGLFHLERDEPERALEVARAGLEAAPRHGGLELVAGLALAADPSRRRQAIPLLERALEHGAAEPEKVHQELAALLVEAGRPAEAVPHLRAAAELVPDSPEIRYRLATALRAAGDAAGAQTALRDFQELRRASDRAERQSKEAGASLNEAQRLASENRLSEALGRVEALLEDRPDLAAAHALAGKILLSLRRPEEALTSIEAARRLEPTRTEYHYLEGMFLLQVGKKTDAREALERALVLDPELPQAHGYLGILAAGEEQWQAALSHLERALAGGVDDPQIRLHYAAALRGVGREEESNEQMDAYRRLLAGRGEP